MFQSERLGVKDGTITTAVWACGSCPFVGPSLERSRTVFGFGGRKKVAAEAEEEEGVTCRIFVAWMLLDRVLPVVS